jgi:hypothetical protein
MFFVHCKCSAVVCRDIRYCGPVVCEIHREKFKGVNGQGCYSLYTKELPQLLLVVIMRSTLVLSKLGEIHFSLLLQRKWDRVTRLGRRVEVDHRNLKKSAR